MPLLPGVEDLLYYRSFQQNFFDFAKDRGHEVALPLHNTRCWLVPLSQPGTHLHLYEEEVTHTEQSGCDQCRIIGKSALCA